VPLSGGAPFPFTAMAFPTKTFMSLLPITTHASIRIRTRELALRAGRVPPHVAQTDYEQAKRELTGESDWDRQEAVLAAIPESSAPLADAA
jgi:hypothetical protein